MAAGETGRQEGKVIHTEADERGAVSANNADALGGLVANECQEEADACAHRACQRLRQQPDATQVSLTQPCDGYQTC